MAETKRRSVQDKMKVSRPERVSSQGVEHKGNDRFAKPAEHKGDDRFAKPVEPKRRERPVRSVEPRERERAVRQSEAERCRTVQPGEPRPSDRLARPEEQHRVHGRERSVRQEGAAARSDRDVERGELRRERPIEHDRHRGEKPDEPQKPRKESADNAADAMNPTLELILVKLKALFHAMSPMSERSFKIRGVVAVVLLGICLVAFLAGLPASFQLNDMRQTVQQQQEQFDQLSAQNEETAATVDRRANALKNYA